MSQRSKLKVAIDREGGTNYADNLINIHDLVQVNFFMPSRMKNTLQKGPSESSQHMFQVQQILLLCHRLGYKP